jgi:nucleotide-binding universal stress UspA family protein
MTPIREILFPTDLSPASDRAFEHARLLAERFRARLVVYHAIEIPIAEYARWGAEHDQEIRARFSQEARAQIQRRFLPPSVEWEVVVASDVAAPALLVDTALLELMRQRRPDLVVMATHGRTGIARAFIGSVTEQVVHRGGRPVLCVRPIEEPDALPYRRILVPTDFSDAARRALPWAATLARAFGAQVRAVYAPPRPTLAALAGMAAAAPPVTEDDLRHALLPDLEGLPLDARVAPPGPAWDAIVRAGADADLIVMSSQGHDSLGDDILGSTTDRVLRHARCPVLVA